MHILMNKYESILHLKRPKLLTDIIADSVNTDTVSNFVDDLERSPYQNAKSVKKHKVDQKSIGFIDDQKSKIKQRKKVKNKIYISRNIADINDELEINDLNSATFSKASKGVKPKKNMQDKVFLGEEQLIEVADTFNSIDLSGLLTVQELAFKLDVPSADIIKWLFLKGISVTINQLLDISISSLVAEHYSFSVSKQDSKSTTISDHRSKSLSGRLRAPVIAVLGHVDHGKTTLLKAVRKDNSPIKEAGNITQAIGSYEISVKTPQGPSKLIFLDTPGHEAFVDMRKRGAEITDLVLLVIAADDGLKPQTIEAISYIQSKNLPLVVAINKIDKPEANIHRVKQQLSDFNIFDDESQSYSRIVGVSALTGQNINLLLSALLDLSKTQNLKSDPSHYAEGTIIEAHLDKQKGPVAQLLIQNGTLYKGDIVVAGQFYGKVKAIYNSENERVSFVESSALADILCFSNVPDVGILFKVVSNEKDAKILSSNCKQLSASSTVLDNRISLEDINQKGVKRIIKQVNLVIKTDTRGSIDAIIHALSGFPQDKVQINLLLVAAGEISFKDVQLAFTTSSIILAFKLNVSSNILHYAEKVNVCLRQFNVIYDLIDYVKSYMLQFVDLDYEKRILGCAEVRNLFFVSKRVIAGCFVQDGQLKKNSYFQLRRKDNNIYVGSIDSLKRLKEDIEYIDADNECGVMCKDYNLWQVGDLLECYDLQPLEKKL